MDSDKKEYRVTEKAGHFVAGQRSPGEGKTILLTPEQASFALAAGQLVDPSTSGSKTARKKAKATPAPDAPASQEEG